MIISICGYNLCYITLIAQHTHLLKIRMERETERGRKWNASNQYFSSTIVNRKILGKHCFSIAFSYETTIVEFRCLPYSFPTNVRVNQINVSGNEWLLAFVGASNWILYSNGEYSRSINISFICTLIDLSSIDAVSLITYGLNGSHVWCVRMNERTNERMSFVCVGKGFKNALSTLDQYRIAQSVTNFGDDDSEHFPTYNCI